MVHNSLFLHTIENRMGRQIVVVVVSSIKQKEMSKGKEGKWGLNSFMIVAIKRNTRQSKGKVGRKRTIHTWVCWQSKNLRTSHNKRDRKTCYLISYNRTQSRSERAIRCTTQRFAWELAGLINFRRCLHYWQWLLGELSGAEPLWAWGNRKLIAKVARRSRQQMWQLIRNFSNKLAGFSLLY